MQTLPKSYGVRRTARFTAFCLLIAYILSLAAYFRGEFSPIYLYLDLAFVGVGVVCAWLFATRPSPRLACILTLVCMMGMGSLICLAMILAACKSMLKGNLLKYAAYCYPCGQPAHVVDESCT